MLDQCVQRLHDIFHLCTCIKLGSDKELKSACSLLVLGEMGVTLTATSTEFIVAVGKRNNVRASCIPGS